MLYARLFLTTSFVLPFAIAHPASLPHLLNYPRASDAECASPLQCILDLVPGVGGVVAACGTAVAQGGLDIPNDIACITAGIALVDPLPESCNGCIDKLEEAAKNGINSIGGEFSSLFGDDPPATTSVSSDLTESSSISQPSSTTVAAPTSTVAPSTGNCDTVLQCIEDLVNGAESLVTACGSALAKKGVDIKADLTCVTAGIALVDPTPSSCNGCASKLAKAVESGIASIGSEFSSLFDGGSSNTVPASIGSSSLFDDEGSNTITTTSALQSSATAAPPGNTTNTSRQCSDVISCIVNIAGSLQKTFSVCESALVAKAENITVDLACLTTGLAIVHPAPPSCDGCLTKLTEAIKSGIDTVGEEFSSLFDRSSSSGVNEASTSDFDCSTTNPPTTTTTNVSAGLPTGTAKAAASSTGGVVSNTVSAPQVINTGSATELESSYALWLVMGVSIVLL